MDPDATLESALALADRIVRHADDQTDRPDVLLAELGIELADRVRILDGWLRQGGFLPNAWKPR